MRANRIMEALVLACKEEGIDARTVRIGSAMHETRKPLINYIMLNSTLMHVLISSLIAFVRGQQDARLLIFHPLKKPRLSPRFCAINTVPTLRE